MEKISLKNSKLKEKNIIAAVLVILLTAVVMIMSYIRIYQITEENCLERMQEAANGITDDISDKFGRDSVLLNALAEIISNEEELDADNIRPIITEFAPIMTARHLGVLLPGDLIIYGSGDTVDASDNDTISFDVESKLGEHVTDRKHSLNPDDNADETMVIRHFVPIKKNGEVVAMLFKTTYLSDLPSTLNVDNIYNGSADVFILDMRSEDGDLLMDTWHDGPLGSMRTSFGIQESKGNVTFQEGIADQLAGGTGYMLVKAPSINEYVFYYYAPISTENWQLGGTDDYNQWSVAVSVPENEVYATLYTVRTVYFVIAGIEAVILVCYLIWTVRNTTVTLEKAVLQERLVKAENAERAKTMFLSNMSHDIRTPMNAIIGYTTLATANIDNKERIQDYLSKILSSSNHLLSLINDVLDMSRIESGRVFIEESQCSLPDILKDLRNILLSQMKSKLLNFFMDTIDLNDEDIWCDKLHLNQVLINLLSNAIKFTPVGGTVSLLIKQLPSAPEGYASYEIRVKDTGIGMSKEFAEHVFEPFEREKTSTVSGIQGTGLGMAIAKNIVEMMGGTITVQSEQGKGTEYTLTLQFRLQSDHEPVEAIKELEGFRALVVDDDFTVCDSVSKMLVQLGLRADWTMSGKEAVLHAKHAIELDDEFKAYIIDWMMPDIGGIEVVRRIRSEVGDNVPIIILTAYDVSDIEEEAKQAGVTAFCNKPIFLSTLRDTLFTVIGQAQEEEEAIIPDTSDDLKGKRILLVEDNELNSEIAQEILGSSGFLVEAANDGSVAVDMVKASADGYYDIILMDVQMPIMNGYDATRAIRKLENPAHANIPIVAMTANAFNEDKMNALEAGMNDHVAKPLDMDRLFEVLHKYLGKKPSAK